MNPPSVSLCGFYAKGNFGDEILGHMLSAALAINGHRVQLFSDQDGIGVRSGLNGKHLDSDVVVIGGGGLVLPLFWALKPHQLDAMLARRSTVAFLNVNVTPECVENKAFIAKLRALQAQWWVRDEYSVQALASVGIEATYLPDIVLTAEFPPVEAKRQIAVFLNDYPMGSDLQSDDTSRYLRAISTAANLAKHLDWMAHWGWKSVLCPLHVSNTVDDRLPAALVKSMCRRRDAVKFLANEQSIEDVLHLVAESSLVISMRFHSTVAAVAAGKPVVDIVHHLKNETLIKACGLTASAVPYGAVTTEALVQATVCAEAEDLARSAYIESVRSEACSGWSDFAQEWARFLEKRSV